MTRQPFGARKPCVTPPPRRRQGTLFDSNRRDSARVDAMLLEDLGKRFADDHLLHYTSCDYHMPLLQGNERYRRWVADTAPAFATIGRPLLQCAPEHPDPSPGLIAYPMRADSDRNQRYCTFAHQTEEPVPSTVACCGGASCSLSYDRT